jgi:hypothetical protein
MRPSAARAASDVLGVRELKSKNSDEFAYEMEATW